LSEGQSFKATAEFENEKPRSTKRKLIDKEAKSSKKPLNERLFACLEVGCGYVFSFQMGNSLFLLIFFSAGEKGTLQHISITLHHIFFDMPVSDLILVRNRAVTTARLKATV
jgi:hypothetical protein